MILVGHYHSRAVQLAPPRSMLSEAIVQLLDEEVAAALKQYQLAWAYDKQLKPLVMNARALMTQPASIGSLCDDLKHGRCSCGMFGDSYKIEVTGAAIEKGAAAALGSVHVRTTDLSLIENGGLRSLLEQGLNHIPLKAADRVAVVNTNIAIAEQFIQRVVQPAAANLGYSVDEAVYEQARQSAQQWTEYKLAEAQQHLQQWEDQLTQEMLRDLKKLQQKLLICEVDKASSTCCFMCPKLAQLLVLLRLEGSADFQYIAANEATVAASLQEQLSNIDPKLAGLIEEGKLPIMRTAYKAHKGDYRYLTNASGSMLSPLNSLAQSLTSSIMLGTQGALAKLNSEVLSWTGARTQACIVVQNAQQVVLNMPVKIETDTCADITKCFENIPIEQNERYNLPEALEWAVQSAFSHYGAQRGQQQLLVVTKLQPPFKVAWQHSSSGMATGDRVYLTPAKALRLLTVAVSNAYVTAAGKVYRQAKGIPMGADYSPDACNLYFMRYEAAAVQRMCRLAGSLELKQKLCKEWLHCFRMMDDIRMVNAPTLASFMRSPERPGEPDSLGWIYPPCVEVDITHDVTAGTSACSSTQYLDALTHIYADGTYAVEVYDKQQKLPFVPVHYIALDSNMPVGSSYKLLLGQAYRIAALCSTADLAAKHIAVVIKKLEGRGFKQGRLLTTLESWAHTDPTLPGKPFTLLDVFVQ